MPAVDASATPSVAPQYLTTVRARLEAAGYTWLDAVSAFTGVAHRSRFQLTKFGMWETFFVFREFHHLDPTSLRAFMREANEFTVRNRAVSLPRGAFAGVATFGVAVARTHDPDATREIRETAPKKHWAAMEMPVVCEATTGRLHYFQRTPVWGAAYYRGLRKQIEELLSP
jgi:hypothetical protein